MKKVGIIPLRAGSKGIPGKNRKKMLGRPLFSWVLGEAIFSELDEIYIFTDDKKIIDFTTREYTWTEKVKVMKRSQESATDTASTETALLEFSKNVKYDIMVLLQATSPLTTKDDINLALKKIKNEETDSVLSVVKTKRFLWRDNGTSVNYDYKKRPRRQEFDGVNIENGAIYVTTRKQFEKTGIRIGGSIALTYMPEDTLIEIDEFSDWIVLEKLIENRLRKKKSNIDKIKAVVLDVDGVFTSGKVSNDKNGEFTKEFSMRDGMGLELARQEGLNIIVMTSEDSEIVKSRMDKLSVTDLYLGVKDKYSRVEKILKERNLIRSQLAYVGDDINDLANICSVGWGIVPNDGIEDVKLKADLILNNGGGTKAIREAIQFLIKYNSRFKTKK